MNGEKLYEIYAETLRKHEGKWPSDWDQLPAVERMAWDAVAVTR